MGSDDTYEAMGQEGEESYVSMQYNEDGNYYTDMSGRHFTNVDSYTDVDGYITTDGREHSDEGNRECLFQITFRLSCITSLWTLCIFFVTILDSTKDDFEITPFWFPYREISNTFL